MPIANRPTRVYVCGPMTGIADLNYPAFAAETARLRALGYDVVSPAELNPNGGTWAECMKRDIAEMLACDVLAWLPGWSNSRGARIETGLARELEITTVMASSITEQCVKAA